MWDLSSPRREWTCVPSLARQILNHWTTREVPFYPSWTRASGLGEPHSFTWIFQAVQGPLCSVESWEKGESCPNSLWPHGLQQARLPCLSLPLGICPSSCPLNWWGHPTISSSVALFSCLQYFPASGSFLVSWLFVSGGQSIGASASVLPMNIQDWFPLRLTSFDLLAVQRTLKSLLQHYSSKASILRCWAVFMVHLSHPYVTTGKTIALTRRTFAGKVMSLLFNMLYRLVITFLPRSKCLSISWLQSPSAVILEPPKNKVSHCFHCFPL